MASTTRSETKWRTQPAGSSRTKRALFVCPLVLLLGLPTSPAADPVTASSNRTVEALVEAGTEEIGFRAGSPIALPIPLSNPTLGVGLTLVGGYLFKADANSETSFVGVGLMATDGGSEAAAATANLSFGEGRWSVAATYAKAALEYSLPGLPGLDFGDLNIRQAGNVAKLRVVYSVKEDLSVGFDTLWLRTELSSTTLSGLLPPVLPGFNVEVEDLLVGPTVEWNTVNDKIYPTSGLSARLTWQYGTASVPSGGFESTYRRTVFDAKTYLATSDAGTLALRGTLCSASSGTPFYNLCVIGATDGMRGFAFGEALGGGLASVQGEYRHRLGTRFGVTAFAGGGRVASGLDALADGTTHYAGGLGVRYRVSKRFPVDFSLDWAINNEGDKATYIYIGQAF